MSPFALAVREAQRTLARRWLGLAVGSLVLAGCFALLLVIGRMPPFSDLITDPLFFRRGLVVHVTLALGVWFYAFLAGLFALMPTAEGPSGLARRSPFVALAGVALLMAAAGLPGAEPVLANYVPVIDHPLFVVGLGVFALGVLFSLLDARLLPGRESSTGPFPVPAAARPAFRTAAVAFVLALLTFAASALVTPRWLPTTTYYETVAWGGGHVLQFASVAAMLGVWLTLLENALGREVLSRRLSAWLFGLLILPLLAAPLLAMQGERTAFTRLMELGIFPVSLTVLGFSVAALVRARRERPLGPFRDPAVTGFATSAVLTVIGFVLGALIHGSNTLVPAHYHAAIGAVTVAFMAATWPLLERLGVPLRGRIARASAWQPVLFGAGQILFAFGFAFAGAHGMGRKLYGTEQQVRTLAETLGLGVMGTGGLVAVAGGLLYIALVMHAWRHATKRGVPWRTSGNIPSRG